MIETDLALTKERLKDTDRAMRDALEKIEELEYDNKNMKEGWAITEKLYNDLYSEHTSQKSLYEKMCARHYVLEKEVVELREENE